jgi:hypothetical protein
MMGSFFSSWLGWSSRLLERVLPLQLHLADAGQKASVRQVLTLPQQAAVVGCECLLAMQGSKVQGALFFRYRYRTNEGTFLQLVHLYLPAGPAKRQMEKRLLAHFNKLTRGKQVRLIGAQQDSPAALNS